MHTGVDNYEQSCRNVLMNQLEHASVFPEDEAIVVTTDDFRGTHPVAIDEPESSVSLTGYYLHVGSDFEFEFEAWCIEDELHSVCETAFNNQVDPAGAAREHYRRTRL